MDDRPLEEWSNEEIRVALLAHGEGNLPVTPTTKPLLMRKLRRLVHTSREGNGTSTALQDGDNCNNQTEDTTASANQTGDTTASANQSEDTTANANQTEDTTASVNQTEDTTASANGSEDTTASANQSGDTTASANQTGDTTASANQTEDTTASANQTEDTTASANQTEDTTASANGSEDTTASANQSEDTTASANQSEDTTASANQSEDTTASANQTGDTTASANQSDDTTASANQSEDTTASAIANESVIEGYYGVSARCDDPGSLHLSPFYTSNAEVLNIIKKHPGIRFNLKKFENRESAEAFSQKEPETISEHHPITTISESKTNNFPSLKTQDLTKLRKLIESHDVAAFVDAIWTNPRYLISSGDSPTILHVSFCYNALHCAVRGGKVEMCRELLAILQSERFWEMVYPDDSAETRIERRRHLIDLYLNMQDSRVPRPGKKMPVQNNETPLHFACKFGYEEIVSFLVSFPQTCTEVKNSFGETPADVVCRNATHSSPRLRERIQELLKAPEVYYIPVLRAVDNSAPPQLGSPCTSEEYTQQQERTVVGSPLTPIVGQAFAGPMSPSKAKEFHREWRSHSSERREASHIKRTDPNRGWERIGRQIARQKEVGWTEYWDFMDCFCDLSCPEGLQQLERYLAGLASSAQTEVDKVAETIASVNISNNGDLSPEKHSPKLTRTVPSSFVTPVKSGWLRHDAVDTPDFLTGPGPTKLDSDVLLALPVNGVDRDQFPHVHQWMNLVKSYPELERKSWLTPASTRKHHSSYSRSLPVSPLVFHSPTHHHTPSRTLQSHLSLSARKTMKFETLGQ